MKTQMCQLLPAGFKKDALLYGDHEECTYMVSPDKPLGNSSWGVQTKVYDPIISEGTVLHMETRLNPIYRHGDKHVYAITEYLENAKSEGVDISTLKPPVVRQAAIEKWFLDKEKVLGFKALKVIPGNSYKDSFKHHKDINTKTGEPNKVTFTAIMVSGVLKVTNAELFRRSLMSGIGGARRWGCGLLLVSL